MSHTKKKKFEKRVNMEKTIEPGWSVKKGFVWGGGGAL